MSATETKPETKAETKETKSEPTQLELIQQGISALFNPHDLVELRVPKARGGKGTISGYFNDHGKLAEAIADLSGRHDGVYVTLNPCSSALLARSANRVKTRAQTTTSDNDILKRTKLLIDIDPVRSAGISATDEEIGHARIVTKEVFNYLKSLSWPAPTSAESGNGFHLLYNIDLPNSKDVTELIKAVLKTLSDKFDTEKAKVDRSVFNAARIVKAYGSLAAKGDSTPERPHRIAKVRSLGSGLVTQEQIQAVANTHASAPAPTGIAPTDEGISPESIEEFFEFHNVQHQPVVINVLQSGPQYKWVLECCPFNPEHKGKDAAVFLTNGALGFKCLHNSCSDNHWKEYRAKAEEDSGKKFFFFEKNGATVMVGCGQQIIQTPETQQWLSLSAVVPKKQEWLWQGRLPLGANTIFAGDPSLGKTLILLDLAARGSTGTNFIDGEENKIGVFDTILLSAEDDLERTIVPRLIGMKADLSKLHTLPMVKTKRGTAEIERLVRLDMDLNIIRQKLIANPAIKLIVVDPLSNYAGGKDIFREQPIREVLMPVTALAQEFGVSIVTVMHNSKQEGRTAMHKVIGAVGIAGVARMGWSFIKDPDDDSKKLMLQMKENLGKFSGIRYSTEAKVIELQGEQEEVAVVKYLGTTEMGINNLILQNEDHKEKQDLPAVALIKHFMQPGKKVKAETVLNEAEHAGISHDSVLRARKKLGIKSHQKEDGWWWDWPTLTIGGVE